MNGVCVSPHWQIHVVTPSMGCKQPYTPPFVVFVRLLTLVIVIFSSSDTVSLQSTTKLKSYPSITPNSYCLTTLNALSSKARFHHQTNAPFFALFLLKHLLRRLFDSLQLKCNNETHIDQSKLFAGIF